MVKTENILFCRWKRRKKKRNIHKSLWSVQMSSIVNSITERNKIKGEKNSTGTLFGSSEHVIWKITHFMEIFFEKIIYFHVFCCNLDNELKNICGLKFIWGNLLRMWHFWSTCIFCPTKRRKMQDTFSIVSNTA